MRRLLAGIGRHVVMRAGAGGEQTDAEKGQERTEPEEKDAKGGEGVRCRARKGEGVSERMEKAMGQEGQAGPRFLPSRDAPRPEADGVIGRYLTRRLCHGAISLCPTRMIGQPE